MKQHKGFTLVEIAIVMMIVGLLLAGTLKGQDVINNARAKRVVSDFNSLSFAVLAYIDRYRSTPGDDARARQHLNDSRASMGDGNGVLQGDFNTSSNDSETRRIWQHLRMAGLLKGNNDPNQNSAYEQLLNPWGGRIGFAENSYDMGGISVCFERVPTDIATMIDLRNDDGEPASGSIRAGVADNTRTAVSMYEPAAHYNLCFDV